MFYPVSLPITVLSVLYCTVPYCLYRNVQATSLLDFIHYFRNDSVQNGQ